MQRQPISECEAATIESVADPIDLKTLLWENVSALMLARWQKENLNRLAHDGRFGVATASRMKQQATNIGIEFVAGAAFALGLEPWQLLVPDLDPAHLPRLERRLLSPQAADLARMLDKISDPARRQQAYAAALAVIELAASPAAPAPPLLPAP